MQQNIPIPQGSTMIHKNSDISAFPSIEVLVIQSICDGSLINEYGRLKVK